MKQKTVLLTSLSLSRARSLSLSCLSPSVFCWCGQYVNPFGLSYPGLGIAPPAASVYASRISMVPPNVPSAFNPYTGINPAYNPLVATRLAASNAALAAAENAYNTRLAEHAYVTRLAASNAALASVETVHASRLALIAAAAGHPFSSVPVDGRLYSSAPESVAFGMQTAVSNLSNLIPLHLNFFFMYAYLLRTRLLLLM